MSLTDLKALVEQDLVPRLEVIEDIEQVTISGGQELPDIDKGAQEPAQEPAEEEEAVQEPGDDFARGISLPTGNVP